jgi:hypothetical protein
MEDEQPGGRVPRVSRLMALAIEFERLQRDGPVSTYRELARAGQISRARMSQIMQLANLAPAVQEELLFLPKTNDRILERDLRRIAGVLDWHRQSELFDKLIRTRLTGPARTIES